MGNLNSLVAAALAVSLISILFMLFMMVLVFCTVFFILKLRREVQDLKRKSGKEREEGEGEGRGGEGENSALFAMTPWTIDSQSAVTQQSYLNTLVILHSAH